MRKKNHYEFILFFQQRTIASFESVNFSSQKDLVDERRAIIEEAFRIGCILSQLLRNVLNWYLLHLKCAILTLNFHMPLYAFKI